MEKAAGDLLALAAYMRDELIRPYEQKARSRLSHVQIFAVSLLYRNGSRSMSELANEMQISKQQLTPLVCKLINQGLLVKKEDENDRRIVRIDITEQGRNMVQGLFAEVRLDIVHKLGTLSGGELAELAYMLKRMMEIFKNMKLRENKPGE